jgi:hypothetical protein
LSRQAITHGLDTGRGAGLIFGAAGAPETPIPPTIDPLASMSTTPPSRTTFGTLRIPACGCPGWVGAIKAVVSVLKLTAVWT